MGKISKDTVDAILAAAKNEEVIGEFLDLQKTGKAFYTKCPICGKEGKAKGLIVTPGEKIYKCFSCDWGGNNPIKFLIEAKGMSYVESLQYLAAKYYIVIQEDKKEPQKKKGKCEKSYCDAQLEASGLSKQDQKAWVQLTDAELKEQVDKGSVSSSIKEVNTFEAGTLNDFGQVVDGNDIIIWYYDLYGNPVTYKKPKHTKYEQLFRIRWQNPELHCDKSGRPMKYKSPYGSGSHLFIPEPIRKAFLEGRTIKRLYIQEGEKKAIKACKHGILSVGVMGIQNIGMNKQLPYAFELIIRTCNVEEVIFVLDADWDHLSNNIQNGVRADLRPLGFFTAIRNYKEYFKAFINGGLYLEIYFAHIIENKNNDKGIDDLLTNALNGNENDLFNDIETSINEKNGEGKYIQLYKISTMPDLRMREIWCLDSVEHFTAKYKEKLIGLKEFQFGHVKWCFNEKGAVVPSQPLQEDEQYWDKEVWETKAGFSRVNMRFRYLYAYTFLNRRGFGKVEMLDGKEIFVKVTDKVVNIVDSHVAKDYIYSFTMDIVSQQDKVDVMDMLYRGGKMYLGPDSISNINLIHPHFEQSGKDFQYLYFKDKYWKITAEGVEEKPLKELTNYVWSDKINNANVNWLGNDFIDIERLTSESIKKYKKVLMADGATEDEVTCLKNSFDVNMSEAAKKSHFIKFILNSSEFYWDKFLHRDTHKMKEKDERSLAEKYETNVHFLSKMSAIGYLFHRFRDKSCEKAVIAMDGKNSEVGDSNGRTGKSLIGVAIGKVIPQVYIGAKSKDLTADPFIFEEVTEKTDNVFLDDVRANVDFEFFFPVITGRMQINQKAIKKYTLSDKDTPKLFITTNHAVNGTSSSFRDRQFIIAFSDYYNDEWKPVNDFGLTFFDEWDIVQWNLFYNFCAYCLILYFKAQKLGWGINGSGLIQSPVERIERRKMRQFFGENFLLWADEYYGVSETDDGLKYESSNIDSPRTRKELNDLFFEQFSFEKKYTTAQKFKNKFKVWCSYRHLFFNPYNMDKDSKPGFDDKRSGVEYFTVNIAC